MRASEALVLLIAIALVCAAVCWVDHNHRRDVDNRLAEAKFWRDVHREQIRLEDQGRRENWRDLQPMFTAIRKQRARQVYLAKVGQRRLDRLEQRKRRRR